MKRRLILGVLAVPVLPHSKIRAEPLRCLAREVRTSRYPYILAGDFNTGPHSPEMEAFRRENVAQLAS